MTIVAQKGLCLKQVFAFYAAALGLGALWVFLTAPMTPTGFCELSLIVQLGVVMATFLVLTGACVTFVVASSLLAFVWHFEWRAQ